MDWLGEILRSRVDLALFLSLALGYAVGSLRLGRFQISPTVGVLLAGLLVGQSGVEVPVAMQRVFFLLFVFAMGVRTGPEFFRGLRSSALQQVALTALFVLTAVMTAWGIGRVAGLDRGVSTGLLTGALTSSTALGAATNAATRLDDQAAGAQIARNVSTAYALTYLLGTVLVIWFLPLVGPRLMRADIREASHQLDPSAGKSKRHASQEPATREIVLRAYRVPQSLNDRTVSEVEGLWPSEQRAVIERVRRADTLMDASPEMQLRTGDIVAVAGRSVALVRNGNPFTAEVDDRELLAVPVLTAELVLTKAKVAGQTLQTIGTDLRARGIFVRALKRAGRELPVSPGTVLERGDVVSVSGTPREVARVAAEVGYAEYPTEKTDLLLVSTAILIGILVGLPAVTVGSLSLSLTASVGVLISGLTLGYLRSRHPRFGRIPDPARALFESLGFAAFMACVGLDAAPGLVPAIRESGITLLAGAAAICVLPHAVTILIGYYVVRMNPAVLLGVCSGAGSSSAALKAIEDAAESKVPTFGYGLPYALGNFLMAVGATLLVLLT
ncbi:MAG TPA: TrkA C-terminal domain-containing protein [Terriglobia bacterium]|nr:TrkA C-terminal domain-containing protein [Terriglobia bacterium]